MKCPQCNAEATQVGTFWICPEHGQLPEPKPFAPLRLFLSYGHDANEELVRRIKADLEKRGHDVWFDKSEIKTGDDWRRSITDGITHSDRFLSFLSRHSTRDPGVCLDEIRIAIGAKGGNIQSILVESEQEVQPPPSISHIQWLDMHDWQERRASGEVPWEKWYQEKLAEIIRVVESDESRKFAGEIRTLEEYLKPVISDFAADARIQKLLERKLTGRAWLFDAIEKWRTAVDRSSRIFWMMGLPGFGKSFFAAHLAHFYGRGTVIGAHFCAYDKPDHRSAPRIIRTLAFQLATRLPDYRKLLLTLPEIADLSRKQTAAELFTYLLANPLKLSITGGRERLLIVIDALDEAGSDGRNELVEMLARHAPSLPDWIGLVVTSRPESDVRAPLQGLNPFVLDTTTEANRADLREFLLHELAPQLQPRPNAVRLVEQILKKSEGVFLYVERFCDDVHRGHLSLDRPEQFPQGLGGIFFQYFQRQFPDLEKFRKDVRPALRAILAAREPLPVEILQRAFTWENEVTLDFINTLGSLVSVRSDYTPLAMRRTALTFAGRQTEGHARSLLASPTNRVISFYHKAVADWIGDPSLAGSFWVDCHEGHHALSTVGLSEINTESESINTYWLAHLPYHLLQGGHPNLIVEALTSLRFLMQVARLAGISWSKGAQIVDLVAPILARSPRSNVEGSKRLSNLARNLPQFAAALELHFVDGCGRSDLDAICKECGHAGIIHGHIDLGGGYECYDQYFAFCKECFWAFYVENIVMSCANDEPWKFNYSTNRYGW